MTDSTRIYLSPIIPESDRPYQAGGMEHPRYVVDSRGHHIAIVDSKDGPDDGLSSFLNLTTADLLRFGEAEQLVWLPSGPGCPACSVYYLFPGLTRKGGRRR